MGNRLSDDLAYASGLHGPGVDSCPNCKKRHAMDALEGIAVVCVCGWTAFIVVRGSKAYCVWREPEFMSAAAHSLYNGLPYRN